MKANRIIVMLKVRLYKVCERRKAYDMIYVRYIAFFFFSIFPQLISATNTTEALNSNVSYEDISLVLQIEGDGQHMVNALYSSKDETYINIEDLFHILNIPCEAIQYGDILRGYLDKEENKYTISFITQLLTVKNKTFDIQKALIKQSGSLYMLSSKFGETLGLNIAFNFRTLSVYLKPAFELPFMRDRRLDRTRAGLLGRPREEIADTVLKRKYHILNPGTLDWSFFSSQSAGKAIESRIGIGLGAELLGGDANVFLNYSDKNKFDKRSQRYIWKWVDNTFSPIRQVHIGKIFNQPISTIYYPIVGGMITNTPSQIRKATGDYTITDYTQPDWTVELYINGILSNYTKSDASGMFTFRIPIVYGYSEIKLKFYGQMGEERSQERTLSIPYNFLPAGELEYKISGGVVEDTLKSKFARAEANYGINNKFSIGGGLEYLSSISNQNKIPFISFSASPFNKVILKGEYAHKVRSKCIIDYYIDKSSLFEIEYNKYVEGQKAILYDYLEERKASLSLPFHKNKISGFSRFVFRQNIYKDNTFSTANFSLSAYYNQLNGNISNYISWLDNGKPYYSTYLALSYKMPRGLTIRPSTQFDMTKGSMIMSKLEIEKRLSKGGYLSISYEKNQLNRSSSLDITFRYDLPFAQTSNTARLSNKVLQTAESAAGSIALGGAKGYTHFSNISAVGRGGIALFAFLDMNMNGKWDNGERILEDVAIRMDGGRVIKRDNDPYVRIVGLEPFVYYTLKIDETGFDNIAWRVKNKIIKVMIDPDQFKKIEIPVIPNGEINGNVFYRDEDGSTKGIGRILVNINRKDGKLVTNTLSENDGYYNYLGLMPGEYTAQIDSIQLYRLSYRSTPKKIKFTIKETEDGDIIDNLNFTVNYDSTVQHPVRFVPADSIMIGNLEEKGGNHYAETVNFVVYENALELYKRLSYSKEFPMGVIRENGLYKIRLGYFITKDDAYNAYRWMMDKGILAKTGLRLK